MVGVSTMEVLVYKNNMVSYWWLITAINNVLHLREKSRPIPKVILNVIPLKARMLKTNK